MLLSDQRTQLRAWLSNYWPLRAKAEALAGEYREVAEKYPLMMADLARYCNAGDTSLSPDPLRLAANEGQRQVWLHIRAMARLDENDTEKLLERTE